MLNFNHEQTDKLVSNPFLFLVISLFLVWIIKEFVYKITPSNKKLPPSPLKLPILGNLHQLSALSHRSFQSLGAKHGPIMLLHFGSRPAIIIQSADAATEILKTHDVIFASKPETRTLRRLLYDMRNISVAPYGEHWRKLRSICVLQLLSNKRVQSFRSIREEETGLLMDKIKSFSSSSCSFVNLSDLFISLTNDVICRSCFGRKYSGGDDGKKFLALFGELLKLLFSLNIGEFVPSLSWINRANGFNNRVDKVAKEFDEFLEKIIHEHLINAGAMNGSGEINFLDILLNKYEDNISIDRVSIKAIILDMLLGGTDTGFATLEWAMTQLLRNPIIMKKLQDEVREVLKGKQDIVDEDLEKMQYLKAVIKETLRYHCPIPFITRQPSEDVKIKGYDIAAGTMVIVNIWAIGRDPASWDEPEKFQPERFLSCSTDFKGQDFELIPFGAGRRGCPGITFAMANVELVLANLVQKFEWGLPNGIKEEDLDCEEAPGITTHRKNPLLAVPNQCYF